MEPPPPGDDAPRADPSSLLAGVAVGLFGAPVLVFVWLRIVTAAREAFDLFPAPGTVQGVTFVAGAVVLLAALPTWAFRKGWRRAGQGALVGLGILLAVVGGCFVLVMTSLENML